VQRARLPLVVGPFDLDGPLSGPGHHDRLGNHVLQLALGAFDSDSLSVDRHVDT
jgi:hypothetical protein